MSFTRETLTHLWSKITGLVGTVKNDVAINKTSIGLECVNLLKNTAVSKTVNDEITFTVNDDGSVTINGTNTSSDTIYLELCILTDFGNREITASIGTIHNGVFLAIYDENWDWIGTGLTGTVTWTNSGKRRVRLMVRSGAQVDNITFYPMLRDSNIIDDTYKPYKQNIQNQLNNIESNQLSAIAINKTSIGLSKKNLLNYTEYMSKISNTNINCGTIVKNADSFTLKANADDCYIAHNVYTIPVLPNTKYILSWAADSDIGGYIYAFRNGDISSRQLICNSKAKQLTITTKSDTNYISIRFGVQNAGDSITYSQIMLRYADITDNTYEPYTPSLQEQVSQNTSTISQLEIGGVYLYNKSSYGTFDEGYVMRVGNQIHINCKITMTKKVDTWVGSVIVLPFAVKTPDDSDRYTIQQTQSDGRTTSVYINKGGTMFYSSTVLEIGDVIEIKGLILDMYVEETATVTE